MITHWLNHDKRINSVYSIDKPIYRCYIALVMITTICHNKVVKPRAPNENVKNLYLISVKIIKSKFEH